MFSILMDYLFSDKNKWIYFTFIITLLFGFFYLRYKTINEAVQELTLPKKEILQNIDFFLQKLQVRPNEECVICLEDFESEEDVYKINCTCVSNHYHKHCLQAWFQKNCSCPVCRKNLREPYLHL